MHVDDDGIGAGTERAGGELALHRRERIVERVHEDAAHGIDHQHARAGHVDSGYLAAVISFGSGLTLLSVALLVSRRGRAGMRRISRALRGTATGVATGTGPRLRLWQCLGGAGGGFFVASQGLAVGTLGVALFIVAFVTGQSVGSLAVDRLGLGPGGVRFVTLPRAVGPLLTIVEGAVRDLAADGRLRVHHVGALEALPERTQRVLTEAEERAGDRPGILVNVAVGYGGRQEITDAVRALLAKRAADGETLEQVASTLRVEDIAEHLYTSGQPDPDLVIRTSGEQRLSGFMLWQSAHSEYYFCDVYWPGFNEVDLLDALVTFAERRRARASTT
jgi:undecaprenyl diphosphate synthase